MLPGLLVGQRGPRLVARAGNVTVEGPQAVLVSNNVYGMGDIAGLGRRARLDRGTLGMFAVTVASAVQAAGLLRGAHSRGVPDAKPQINWNRLWQLALTVPGTGRATPDHG